MLTTILSEIMGTKRIPVVKAVLLLVWSLLSFTDAVSHFCKTTKETNYDEMDRCSNHSKRASDGFNLNKEQSDLSKYTDTALRGLMNIWAKDPGNSPKCIFSKKVFKDVNGCCGGWTGSLCNRPVCTPSCANGGTCTGPMLCRCKSGFVGPQCDDIIQQVTPLKKYCYLKPSCFGDKPKNYFMVLTKDVCCSKDVGGQGWGLIGQECESCSKITSSDLLTPQLMTADQPNVITNPGLLTYRTCMTTGPNYFRTFDGLEFLFPGRCTYNLLEIDSMSLRITDTRINCHRFCRCRKRLQIEKGLDTVIAEGSLITINGDPVLVTTKEGYASPSNGFRIEKRGDYFYAEFDMLRLRWDDENTVFITFEGMAAGQLNIAGMCGNYNQNPHDDFVTPSGTKVTDPYEFGSSWAITHSAEVCQQVKPHPFTCATPEEEKAAKDACGVLLKEPFMQCHDQVYVQHYYSRCVNDYCLAGHETTEEGEETVNIEEEQKSALCQTLNAYSQMCTIRKVVFSWRTSTLCPRGCPANMHYTECSPKCLQTCSNMQTITPASCDGECYPGCECLPGMYLNNSKCIDASLCPCQYQGQYHEAGSMVNIGCNQCKCTQGQWKCTEKLCSKTCSVLGFQHFITFDGATYDFHGPPCTYTLVELNDKSTYDLHVLTRGNLHISQTVKNCESKKKVSCTAGVQVVFTKDSQKYEINVDSNFAILVNGNKMEDIFLPYMDDNIYVKQATSLFVLIQGSGFRVLYDRNGRIYVRLDPFYAGKVRGLCGDMDGSIAEEFKSRRNIEESVVPFAMSYSSCPAQSSNAVSGMDWCAPDPIEKNFESRENKLCLKIGNRNIWGDCLKAVDYMQYRGYCNLDSCVASDPAVVVCTMVAALAQQCMALGFDINWMDDKELLTLCNRLNGYSCSGVGGQFYTECATPFGNCRDKQFPSQIVDPRSCIGGCMCRDRRLLNDFKVCSNLKECTCYDQYTKAIFKPGSTAKQICANCTCTNGTWDCGNAECGKNVDCPLNQVFRKHITNCGSTCETLDVAKEVCEKDKKFFDGCGCQNGLVMLPNGTCVKPDECPCNYNGNNYLPGSTVAVGCATYLCANRIWVKQSTMKDCKSTCAAYGDPHYHTFDGKYYSFQGGCEYTLTRSKGDGNFSVVAENVACGSTGATCTKVVTIKHKDLTIKLIRGMSPVVNEKEVNPISEFEFTGGSLFSTDLFIMISLDIGMDVMWDGQTQVYISLSEKYKNQVEGLCGNYDDILLNEFTDVKTGVLSATPGEFANRWKVSTSCPDVNLTEGFDTCQKNPNRAAWAKEQCKIITDGPVFEKCREQVAAVDEFYKNCLFDACGCDEGGDCECLCTAVSAFAKACSDSGVHVKWRSNKFCPKMCENGMNYDPCVSPCRPSCDNIALDKTDRCQGLDCVEGCICPDDMVLNDVGECIPISKCTCKYQEHQFSAGTIIEINCQKCLCTSGKFVCTGHPCQYNCTQDEFLCPSDARCIPMSQKCDGISDCLKNADEVNCTSPCDPDEFTCNRLTQCVPQNMVCDGRRDCRDGSDESNCAACKDQKFFQCQSIRCIPQSFVCDGKLDCGLHDLSDESNCTEQCDENDFFRCTNNKCLPKFVVCDQHDDCGDGSDERLCTPLCPPGNNQIKYRYGVDGFKILVNGLSTGEDSLLGSGKALTLPGGGRTSNSITIVRLDQPEIFNLVHIEVCVIGAKSISFQLTHADGNVENFMAKQRNGKYFLDVASQSKNNIKMVAIVIREAGVYLKVENLFMIICVAQVTTVPPAVCLYGDMPVLYDFDDYSFVTLVDKKPNVDVLEGSRKDIKFDGYTEHQIVIKREKSPKSFNVNYVKITVTGAGIVSLTLTTILGQSASKKVKFTGEQRIMFEVSDMVEDLDGEILMVVLTFTVNSASINIECLSMSACLSLQGGLCVSPITVNYKEKNWKSVLLTSSDDVTVRVVDSLKGSSAIVPNLLLKPRMRYNYTIDFVRKCPTNFLITDFTFSLEGVCDLKLMIGSQVVLEKARIDETPYFVFKLSEPVVGNSISLTFVAEKRDVCLFNVEVELCCSSWSTTPARRTASTMTPYSKKPCHKPMIIMYGSPERFTTELLQEDHTRIDASQSLRGSATKRWMVPSSVTGSFKIILNNEEQCSHGWNVNNFRFTLEGVKEFSVIIDDRYIIQSEKVRFDKVPVVYEKQGAFHGRKLTLIIHKRETSVYIYNLLVTYCCDAPSTATIRPHPDTFTISDIYANIEQLCSEPIRLVYNSYNQFHASLFTEDGDVIDAKEALRGSPDKWTIPAFVTGPFTIVLANEELCDNWRIDFFNFTVEGVKEFSVFIDSMEIISHQTVEEVSLVFDKFGNFFGNNFTLIVHQRDVDVSIYNVEVTYCCEVLHSTSSTMLNTETSVSGLTEVMCDEPKEIAYNSEMLFFVSIFTEETVTTIDAKDALRDSPIERLLVPSDIPGPFGITLVNEEACELWRINRFQFTLEGVKEFVVLIDGKEIRTHDTIDNDSAATKKVEMVGNFHGNNFTVLVHERETEVYIYNLEVNYCCDHAYTSSMFTSSEATFTSSPTLISESSSSESSSSKSMSSESMSSETFMPSVKESSITMPTSMESSTVSGSSSESTGTEETSMIFSVPTTINPPFLVECAIRNVSLQSILNANGIGCTLMEDIPDSISQCGGPCRESYETNYINTSNSVFPKINLKTCSCCSAMDGYWESMTVDCANTAPLNFQVYMHTACNCTACSSTVETVCSESQFQCHLNKQCIQLNLFCDGVNDCDDGSDETNCGDYIQNPSRK